MNFSLNCLWKCKHAWKWKGWNFGSVRTLRRVWKSRRSIKNWQKKMKRDFSLEKKSLPKKFSFFWYFSLSWRLFSFSLDFPLFPVFLPKSYEMKSTYKRKLFQHSEKEIVYQQLCRPLIKIVNKLVRKEFDSSIGHYLMLLPRKKLLRENHRSWT